MSAFPSYSQFHEAVTGRAAYPWQSRLAEQCAEGDFPKIVDVPTGLGKSSTVLIAVWALARQVDQGKPRTMPQRIVHVVDRRRVVDEVHAPAAMLATQLTGPDIDPVLRPVAEALRKLAGPWRRVPLAVQRIHGEVGDSYDWLRPTGCCVVGATPHQVVSRLLFRGFGVSPRTRSLHAGLLGVDTLFLLDEPHLSAQAIATLSAALSWQSKAPRDVGVPASRLILVGATVPDRVVADTDLAPVAPSEVFSLSQADLSDGSVAARLHRAKPVQLTTVEARLVDKEIVALAKRSRASGGGSVGVMVNTVATARAVHAALVKSDPAWQLVTSRMRGTDRAQLNLGDATAVVATQCLEVGVDISFDTLVTEACPYPVLVQRLGRLDRDATAIMPVAHLVGAVNATTGAVVVRPGSAKVYGAESVAATQRYLDKLAGGGAVVPMDLATQLARRDHVPHECWPDTPRLATFHAGYAPTMTTTYPTPVGDMPLAAFITGPDEQRSLDVSVAWRADLGAVHAGLDPLPAEQVAVPLPSVCDFLVGKGRNSVVADVNVPGEEGNSGQIQSPHALVRRDTGWVQVTHTRDVKPGDSIVLTCQGGGYIDGVGWAPESTVPVTDQAVIAADLHHRVGIYRQAVTVPLTKATLTPFLISRGFDKDKQKKVLAWLDQIPGRLADSEVTVETLSDEVTAQGLPSQWRINATDTQIVTVTWENPVEKQVRVQASRQSLHDHAAQAATVAADAATAASLPKGVADLVTAATWRHDDGKAHPSFQRYLGNSDLESPVAKSLRGHVGSQADRRFAAAVGHPAGWRHEGASAAAARSDGVDELVEHLIGAHHGRFRPFLASTCTPHTSDPTQDEQGSRAAVFDRLNREWGPWGLAYLESVVRLSDWYASAHPHEGPLSSPPMQAASAARGSRPLGPDLANSDGVLLKGLVSSPMTGWYAVAGLLSVVDEPAAVCWRDDPADLCAPRWFANLSLADAVEAALRSPRWDEFDFYGAWLTSAQSYAEQYQKIGPATAVRRIVRESARAGASTVCAITQDASPLDGDNLPLVVPAFANNSSYPARAFEIIDEARRDLAATVQEIVDALTDPLHGWRQQQCDGGMDRPPLDGGIRGVEPYQARQVRQVLSPLALLGMGAFGAGPLTGVGTTSTESCTLPCPAEPSDVLTLGALLRLGPHRTQGQRVTWQCYKRTRLDKESVWTPVMPTPK
ncbi:hypothetical protein KEM60_02040 [Austwickia sp. TVS 96-490-7B]|uniref:type I-G CRISPR-associated helicase/endonuclease Cas3g n=1 Tax=Austwickia sp. TVS 96-490-7B TaxID=2830843 RepID=UPI001C581827|nr:type I-U CRISPR-associated helicase/endonuclease Cas3 [Austwickia sp. TVS 96-490-7B]MBW3085829.1 hypothetical protein [Austwickia sp. TVS 96-490-7B]